MLQPLHVHIHIISTRKLSRVVAHAQLVYGVVSGSRVNLIRNPRVTAKAEVGSRVTID